jgi:cysteine desulfurase/selenocysteine lyase
LKRLGVEIDIIPMTDEFLLDMDALVRTFTQKTKLVAVCHVSNVFGTILPISNIAALCKKHNALLLVDGSQSVPHLPINVDRLECDFFCFSGHKMLGPTGTGVLWMRKGLPPLSPLMVGGGSIEYVTDGDDIPYEAEGSDESGYTLLPGYQRYEAGTPNISGGIGLGAAADYLTKIGMETVQAHERDLTNALITGLQKIPGVTVYAPSDPMKRTSVVSFNVEGFHPHEVAQYLDSESDIMVRSGHHCCMPVMNALGIFGSVRASTHVYSSLTEIEALIAGVKELVRGQ